uniref:Period circadian protein homolog 2 n=1 Tax=Amphiprion ocellaris TaxID=80972 RepID=A0AAQ5ZZD8_AMPOC
MSEDSDSKPYCFPVLQDQDGASGCRASTSCGSIPRGASGCSSMAQLHRMGGYSQGGPDLGLPSEGSDSSGQDPPTSPHNLRKNTRSRSLPEEDVEMKSSGSSGSGTESHSNESHGNESHGNESHGHESLGSSNGNSKDSALLESSESNKSSNSHSPSPPSSSNAFSLLSSEQDNPSTSGCSSEESAKVKTQKEVIKTLKELKLHLPAEKRHNNKSTTLNTLKYALRCVKQVEANEEYYQLLMINDSQPSGLDVSSYTIEEIDSITSEYTLKNNDIFAVAVSLITGRIVYISDQAASILNCKRDVFKNSKFVEFLTPQDVSVFYSFTTPYRLPSWSMCTGAESSPPDCMQEKSFFCRISGGKECEGDLQYYPFRMTPYLMKVQDTVHAEDQFCCLLLAERVHSGYDAPRIPTDKRIFTTTHTPSCVFQDVDERAVPLLGYLPQDLIGTPVLLHLHPNDRPIMLAIHRKILQYAGQPFDHSSIRFCARNGEYIILDTSWSSFVNPWSRKVSFVIGRHKVRMGPVNEDVFVAPASTVREVKSIDSDIQEITEQIHRLLLQVKGKKKIKEKSQDKSYNKNTETDHCVVIDDSCRYLESCNVPITMKRKCQSSSNTTSSNSDEDKQKGTNMGTSLPLPVPNKPESVVSITSQCSYSSTIVHVGDKKPQPESEIIEDVPGAGETAEPSLTPGVPPAISPPSQERESYKKLGLTKQVLAAHTQKEEQAFLCRFRELRGLASIKANCSEYLERQRELITSDAPTAEPTPRRGTRNKKTKSKRAKQIASSDSTASHHRQQQLRPPLLNHGLNQTSWSTSEASQSTFPMAYPAMVPGYPLQVYPTADNIAPPTDAPLQGFGDNQGAQAPPCPPSIQAAPFTSPIVTPIVALVLPNYLYPLISPPFVQAAFPGQSTFTYLPSFSNQNQLNAQNHFTSQTGGGQTSPPLFQSRCSSPLNLLELELSVDRQDSTVLSSGGQVNNTTEREKGSSGNQAKERDSRGDGNNSDANSSSSDMLDIILQEDSCSGTGSATSGSMGSGSNGCGTSASGTSKSRTSASGASASGTSGSGTGSNNSSKYFGSVDSSQNSQKVKSHSNSSEGRSMEMEPSEHFKYVLQDPLWLLMANTDDKVMMTYQLPSRDIQKVLREDKEKLRLLQKHQPRFTEEQKKELIQVHPWIKKGGLPKAIDVKVKSNACFSSTHSTAVTLKPHLNHSLFSRCVPAVTAARTRQWQQWRISQTWTSVTQRQKKSAASRGPQRSPQALWSSPATALLRAPACKHNQRGNKLLNLFGVTFLPSLLY